MLRTALSRRRFLAGLTVSAGMLLLAACAPSAPSPTPTPAPAAEKPSEKPAQKPAEAKPQPAGSKIELFWFLPLSAAPEIKIWEDFVKRFQEAYPNITVKGSYEPWNDYWVKLQTVMAGGAVPDVIWLHYTRIHEWASKDVMRPLDPLLQTDKIDPNEFVFIEGFKYKGKIYGLPKDNGITALWYNIDMYQKAGVPLPTKEMTWEEFLERAKRLTIDDKGKTAADPDFNAQKIVQWAVTMVTTSPRGEGFWTWYKSLGGKLYDDEFKHCLIDQPESIEALQFMADFRAKYRVAPMPGAITEPGDPFRIGKTAGTRGHHATAFFLREEKRTFKWDETFYPRGKGGLVISGGATGFAIPKATRYPDQAWILTKFMTSEEQQKIIIAQKRWASGLRKLVPLQYDPEYHTPNYKMIHVDPLTGVGPQAEPAPSPAALAEIEQVWNSAMDPVWLGKVQVKDVVRDLKAQIDQLLQRPTRI